MLSIGQKVVALGVLLAMNVALFAFSPLFGILALFGTLPFAFVVAKR